MRRSVRLFQLLLLLVAALPLGADEASSKSSTGLRSMIDNILGKGYADRVLEHEVDARSQATPDASDTNSVTTAAEPAEHLLPIHHPHPSPLTPPPPRPVAVSGTTAERQTAEPPVIPPSPAETQKEDEEASRAALLEDALHVDYESLPPVLDYAFDAGECQESRVSARGLRDFTVISHALKAVYIPNLKAGFMAVRHYLNAYGKTVTLHNVNLEKVLKLVKDGYTFFTFVRDPLTRLRSAYSETLYHTKKKPEKNHLAPFIKMKPSVRHLRFFVAKLRCCREKFVKEIYHADSQHVFIGLGGPVNATRGKGMPPYAFIGRQETMERDWRHLLIEHLKLAPEKVKPIKKFHSSTDVRQGHKSASGAKASSTQVSLADPVIQSAACKIYAIDYKCFGYPLPPVCLTNSTRS